MRTSIICLLLALAFGGCRQNNSTPSAVQTGDTALYRIENPAPAVLDSLRGAGGQILVHEQDFVIVRLPKARLQSLEPQKISYKMATQEDLKYRLVQIATPTNDDRQTVADLGLDIWQVKPDSLLARALDIQLDSLRVHGLVWTVIYDDAREALHAKK